MGFDSIVDRLSTLPNNVVESILMRLTIKDAVQTSILSRRWRYEWSNISQLVFDRQYFLLHEGQNPAEFDKNLVKIVDHVLLLHHGPVLSFELSTDLESCVDIDRWILFLSRNGIKDLTLHKWKGEIYKLHSSVFSCYEMTSLELLKCTINLPDSFKGFMNLTVLDLQSVSISSNTLEFLISMCPQLMELSLINISGCTRLNICAQKLVELSVEGAFEELSLESTPLLAEAAIKLKNSVVDQSVEIFDLPSIKKLELLIYTLRILTSGDVPMRFPSICPLEHLAVEINFEDMLEISGFMWCFRSSPVLQTVIITVCSNKTEVRIPVDHFWEVQEDHSCQFSSLRIVEVTAFSGSKSEMKFIECILANAPVLETLQIKFKENVCDMLKILKEFVQFRRRSTKVQMLLPD